MLVRVDLNVPVEAGKVTDDTRIRAVLPTIRELADKGGKVILLAHFGRPKGEDPALSLAPIAGEVASRLGKPVAFASATIGAAAEAAVAKLQPGEVLLLENTRFDKREEKNEPDFVAALAGLGDIYVNDAFATAHRAHASTEGLAHKLPAYAGRCMQEEIEALAKALEKPERPVMAVVGGAKVSSKLELLGNLVAKVDILVIGGGMANTFLAAQGKAVGKSLCEHDLAGTAREILEKAKAAGCEIVLPVDALAATEFKAHAAHRVASVDDIKADEMMLDAGPASIDNVIAEVEDGEDRGVERSVRRLRAAALRHRHGGGGESCGGADRRRQAALGRRRRRHGGGAEPCRRCRPLHLCLDGGRRLPGMAGRQGAAGGRGAQALTTVPGVKLSQTSGLRRRVL